MTCVICKVEMEKDGPNPIPEGLEWALLNSSFLICPSCGLVYKEKE